MAIVKKKSPAETNEERAIRNVHCMLRLEYKKEQRDKDRKTQSVKETIEQTTNRPKEIIKGVSDELKKRAEENPFRSSQVSSDARFSILRYIKLLPKWYSKKTWSFMLSFGAVLIGIIIFSFAKFGIIPGIASWVVCWGVWMVWWNHWWKKNSADFLINMTNIIEKCVVDKDGKPVYVD